MYEKVLFLVLLCHLRIVVNFDGHESCKHRTCHECIRDPTMCVWCSAENYSLDERCKPADSNKVGWCQSGALENPQSKIVSNSTLDNEDIVQIKPQRINMKLRVGEPMNFEFYYKAAENYPVDLYFLLDASLSMKGARDSIVQKSEEIYNELHGLTTNVYLGLGTFVDKNLIPYNRKPADSICYSFKHNLNLTDDVHKFNEALKEVEFGFNYDKPEGGLDGLAQVMACKDKFAWRRQSRKLIIFVTDDDFHSAGDGKWSGIFKPYDGGCYMNNKGFYDKEKEMDYPSVGMISMLAAKEQFTIIFSKTVVTRNKKISYETLSSSISGAIYSTYEQKTISKTLANIYKNISQNINLDVNFAFEDQKYFEINFDPDCRNKENEGCKVVLGEVKAIHGNIKLLEFYGKDRIEIPIVQRGLKEQLTLDIDIISSCDCESLDETDANSTDCSLAGDRQCGICNCNKGRSGPNCACVENQNSDSSSNTSCIKDGVECSNRGVCFCGVCRCYSGSGFDGPYCEFRTDSCKRDRNGALCSGHGKCRNGQCQCDARRWTGEACDCSKSRTLCLDSDGNECNNRGHCECGRCKCNKLPIWDVRDYSDEFCNQKPCEDCHKRQCRALVNCLSCNGIDCPDECTDRINVVDVTEDTSKVPEGEQVCTNVRVKFGCYSSFSYIYNDVKQEITLYVHSEPNCIESYYIYGGISLIILVLTGIAALIAWKLATDARDREEFERFLAHAREEDEEIVNACYKPSITKFENPMFGKSSFRKRSFR